VTANRWAELRQVGFATLDHAAAVRTATDLLALGPGFGDPLLADLGLADFTAPVGPGWRAVPHHDQFPLNSRIS
jgi:hypothetical protein